MGRGLHGRVDKDIQREDSRGCPEVVQKTSQDSSSHLQSGQSGQSGSWRSDERLRREDKEFREIFFKDWACSWNNPSSLLKTNKQKKRFIYLVVPGLSCGMWELVPQSGIEPKSPALGTRSLSFWTIRKVALRLYLAHFRAKVFCKGPAVSFLGPVGYTVSCHCSAPPSCCENSHRPYSNEWAWLCFNKILFTKTSKGVDLTHET